MECKLLHCEYKASRSVDYQSMPLQCIVFSGLMQLNWIWYHQKCQKILIPMIQVSCVYHAKQNVIMLFLLPSWPTCKFFVIMRTQCKRWPGLFSVAYVHTRGVKFNPAGVFKWKLAFNKRILEVLEIHSS